MSTSALDPSEVYLEIESFYNCLKIGYYESKFEAMSDLDIILNELNDLKIKYELIVEKYDFNVEYDGLPKYAVNMPKWTRDQIRSTYNEIRNLKIKIQEDGVNFMREQLPSGGSKPTATKKGQKPNAPNGPQLLPFPD
jgi:hypothetical protein